MLNKSFTGAFALATAGLSLLVLAGGCADRVAPPPALAPIYTSAEVKAPPPPAPPVLVIVTPNVSVSEGLVAACKLKLDDAASAPKFEFDQSLLDAGDSDALSQIARCVTTGALAGRALELVGRADPRGETEYNMALGDRRASSVRQFLSSQGVDSTRLSETSRGNLDATGTDESTWQRDRRVDILLR